jgi:hypothetical protein
MIYAGQKKKRKKRDYIWVLANVIWRPIYMQWRIVKP